MGGVVQQIGYFQFDSAIASSQVVIMSFPSATSVTHSIRDSRTWRVIGSGFVIIACISRRAQCVSNCTLMAQRVGLNSSFLYQMSPGNLQPSGKV